MALDSFQLLARQSEATEGELQVKILQTLFDLLILHGISFGEERGFGVSISLDKMIRLWADCFVTNCRPTSFSVSSVVRSIKRILEWLLQLSSVSRSSFSPVWWQMKRWVAAVILEIGESADFLFDRSWVDSYCCTLPARLPIIKSCDNVFPTSSRSTVTRILRINEESAT